MKFEPVVQEEMSFKDIFYLELWRPFCSVQWNHLCNFGRLGIKRNNSVKVFLIWSSDSRDMSLKIYLIWSSGGPFVQWSRTICATIVEGILRNNSLNLFRIWASG